MITRVRVGGVGRDDVAHPTEQATRTDPQAWRDDEPQDTGQEPTVVELSDSGDDRAQNRRYSRITHGFLLLLSLTRPFVLLTRTLADQDILAIGLRTYFGRDDPTQAHDKA
jgi:hypothetical protein